MAKVDGAAITLKAGDYVDTYVLVNGELVPVRIQTENEGPEDSKADVPSSSNVHAATLDHENPSVNVTTMTDVPDIGYMGSGGHMAILPVTVHSGTRSSSVGDLLATLAEEDTTRMGSYTVERSTGQGAGRIVLDTPFKSEIVVGMKDVGSL